MKSSLTLVLVGLLVAGCASVSRAGEAVQPPAAGGAPAGNPTGNAPGGEAGAPGAPAPGSASQALPLSVTVRPPAVPLQPVQGTPGPGVLTPLPPPNAGWRTFTSPTLGVALDYPPDWSVTPGAQAVTFASPQGDTIVLQASPAGAGKPADLQCASLMNAYAQSIDTCFEAAAGRYSASLDLNSPGASTQRVTLSTLSKAALEVYKAMFDSLRPAG